MALTATIYKAELTIADMDRHYYAAHDLTIARHPSETDLRMMLRLAAFALNASDRLSLTKGGIGGDDEPDLWEKNYAGEITLWIELGQPDDKRLRKACGRAEKVTVYPYNANSASVWWQQNRAKYDRFDNLSVIRLSAPGIEALTRRTMRLQATIQDGELTLHGDDGSVAVEQTVDKTAR